MMMMMMMRRRRRRRRTTMESRALWLNILRLEYSIPASVPPLPVLDNSWGPKCCTAPIGRLSGNCKVKRAIHHTCHKYHHWCYHCDCYHCFATISTSTAHFSMSHPKSLTWHGITCYGIVVARRGCKVLWLQFFLRKNGSCCFFCQSLAFFSNTCHMTCVVRRPFRVLKMFRRPLFKVRPPGLKDY